MKEHELFFLEKENIPNVACKMAAKIVYRLCLALPCSKSPLGTYSMSLLGKSL
jgi:hypothetical protein